MMRLEVSGVNVYRTHRSLLEQSRRLQCTLQTALTLQGLPRGGSISKKDACFNVPKVVSTMTSGQLPDRKALHTGITPAPRKNFPRDSIRTSTLSNQRSIATTVKVGPA